MELAIFELSMLGGAFEQRYRKLRPDIERLPWRSLDPTAYPRPLVDRARRFWTQAAFQEHKTSAACAATLEALISARAPVDLVAVASGFILDEMAHVELCARVAGVLGGAATLKHDPDALFTRPARNQTPLERAAELVLTTFCVGEAFSVPMQRATAQAMSQPLIKGVIQRIAKDEAAHGRFGWIFFDWAAEALDGAAHERLRKIAARTIAAFEKSWELIPDQADAVSLGWLPAQVYRRLARRTMDEVVIAPLRARNLLD